MRRAVVVCPNPECPDLEATGVPGEYVFGTEVCPYCGAQLVDPAWSEAAEEGSAAPSAGDTEPQLEAVFSSDDPSEIHVVRSILDGAGIPILTTHDSTSDRVLPGFDPTRFMRGSRGAVFWVPADRAEEARALLTEVAPDEESEQDGE
jgi:hypothetical protein